MSTVIKVENVSKLYRLGEVGTGTLSHDLNRWYHRLRGKEDPYLKIGESNDRANKGSSEYVYALKDINFEVKEGEVLGIIGKNGAGKSTLLKLLSRVTGPSSGSIKIKGRTASLLEVGTGFHPELTGRENIFLNGAILGMTKSEIRRKFDEIVDFSGVERYIDTPVKRYSSGMYVRLAFAVAAHLDPEILIVDEVLAVGDAEFQKRCLGKMGDISKNEGRTILFVSHNMAAVRKLCKQSLLLKDGALYKSGDTEDIMRVYNSSGFNKTNIEYIWNDGVADSSDIKPIKIEVFSRERKENNQGIFVNNDIVVRFDYGVNTSGLTFIQGLSLYNEEDINVFNSHNLEIKREQKTHKLGVRYSVECIIPKNLLNAGRYYVSIALFNPSPFILYFNADRVIEFELVDIFDGSSTRGEYLGSFPGVIRPFLNWRINESV
ncbi:ABC transporter ATP-binding protein [Fulvivirgaceae bacterium LMO-SS25]